MRIRQAWGPISASARIDALLELLAAGQAQPGRLHLPDEALDDPHCPGTASQAALRDASGEISGYVWDAKAAKQGEERPVKVDDDGPDALRSGMMGTRRWWRHWLSVDPTADAEAA